MKKKYKYLGLLGLLPFFAAGQLTNSGATIVIEPGATLVVEGKITNEAGSMITNEGTIEVGGDLENLGTLTSTETGAVIKFVGDAPQVWTNNSNVAVDRIIVGTSDDNVSLMGSSVTVNDDLTFESGAGNLNIGDSDLIFGSQADAISGAGTDAYIQADGMGKVSRTFGPAGTFTFPIGDSDEYSPIALSNVPTGESGIIAVNVEDASLGGELPDDVDDFITRNWTITPSGFSTSPLNATATGTYVPADVGGAMSASLIKGASYEPLSMEWSYEGADGAANTVIGTIGDDEVQFTGTNAFRRQAISAFLEGPLSGSTMSNGLNTSDNIPLTSPYDNTTTTTQAVLDNNSSSVVDWVTVQLRTPADGSTEILEFSKLLLQDGTIIDPNGGATPTFRDAPAAAFVAINHRNHLGVMTAGTTTLGGPLLNFGSPSTLTFGTDAQKNISGVMAMYAGEVDGNDGSVLINDINTVIGQFNQTGYNLGDFNFDTTVLINDVNSIIANFNKIQQY